jgi:hypothetical protein
MWMMRRYMAGTGVATGPESDKLCDQQQGRAASPRHATLGFLAVSLYC